MNLLYKQIEKLKNVNIDNSSNNTQIENAIENIIVKEAVEVKTPLLPIDGFCRSMQELIEIYSSTFGTHRDYWAASIISATSEALGQSVKLKGKYINVPILWIANVGSSGDGKTEAMERALAPFYSLDKESYCDYENKIQIYDEWKGLSKEERKAKKLPEQNQYPKYYQYILQDFSPESLTKVHSINKRSILIHRDELMAWINDMNRYNKSGEQQNYLSLFMGKSFITNRVNVAMRLDKTCVNILGGIQPQLLSKFAKDNRDQDGTIPRFCFAFPDNAVKPKYSTSEIPKIIEDRYYEYIKNLLSLEFSLENENYIYLINEASFLYEKWFNKNAELSNNEQSEYLKSVYAKLDIICLRTALIIHFSNWAFTGIVEEYISIKTMQSAIDITEYFRITGRKVYNILNGKVTLNKTDLIKTLDKLGNTQPKIAEVTKVSQQYVSKVLNKD